MDPSPQPPEFDALRQEREALAARLRARDAEVEALTHELDETNQGVVALYAELDLQAEQLRHVSDLKSRFLSYLSHEFRTPLGAVQSIARILLDRLDGPLTAEQERQVAFIQGSAAELSVMVDDLLDLAKVEAGRISVSPAWFTMVDLFAALRGMFRPLLTSEAVTLVFEEPDGIVTVYSDNGKLSQILRNFISNALKFTTQGEVRVSARPDAPGMVRFAVTDTGIGIPEEFHQRIFQDFVQVDSQMQRRVRGTGLGLSLSRKLAALLGGTVGVESTPGQGSTFYVTIPERLPSEGHDEAGHA